MNLRHHYLSLTLDHIDDQISQLKERRADLSVELIRATRKMERLPAIPSPEAVVRRCVEVEKVEVGG